MSRVCEMCEKKYQKGNQVTVAWGLKYRSIKRFSPNLRNITLPINGVKTRVRACAKCVKKLKGQNSNVKIQTSNQL